MSEAKKHPHDAVIRAWLDGKKIELCCGVNEKWVEIYSVHDTRLSGPIPAFYPERKYRIKPEPIVRYGIINSEGLFFNTFSTEQQARQYSSPFGRKIVRLVQDMDYESNKD